MSIGKQATLEMRHCSNLLNIIRFTVRRGGGALSDVSFNRSLL